MGVRTAGPFNSGAAVGANGVATANTNSTIKIKGWIVGVYVKYNDSPPAATTDVTVATLGTSPSPPSETLLSLVDGATDGWRYPWTAVHSTLGVALTYDGTHPICAPTPIDDLIKVTIAQANAADNVDVWLLIED